MEVLSLILLMLSVAHGHTNGYGGPSPVAKSLQYAEAGVLAYVDVKVHCDDKTGQYFRAKVRKVYKGCGFKQRDRIFIKSPSGVALNQRAKYLLFGSLSMEHISGYSHQQPVLTIGVGYANTPFNQIARPDRRLLNQSHQGSCRSSGPSSYNPRARAPQTWRFPGDGSSPVSNAGFGGGFDSYNAHSSCSRYDCGALPYDSQSSLCPDGETKSGITGNCVRNSSTYKCEWEIQTCPSCSSDSACRSGQICANGFCAPADCVDRSGCPRSDQFCEAGRCKTCYCDAGTPLSMCPDGETMGGGHGEDCLFVDGSCRREYVDCPKCVEDSGCRSDQICVDGFCRPAECSADTHCGPYELCNHGRCKTCDCGSPRAPFMCHDLLGQGDVAGECMRVSNGQCDYKYSKCEDCHNSNDCSKLDKGICVNGQCESVQCLSDNDCANDEVCQENQCVPCDCGHPDRAEFLCHDKNAQGNLPGACYRSENGQCVYEYSECEKCYSDDDCYRLDKGVCMGGQCESAQCLNDDHCAYNEVCEGNQCIQCNCGNPTREEFICHDLIGMGNVAGDCYRADNGQCVFEYSTCDKCESSDDCYKLDKGICANGHCESAQCLSDSHCAYNEVCENYQCIPCNCGHPDREEFMCHDLAGIGNVAGDCYRADNGQCAFEYSACDKCDSNDDCSKLDKGICVGGQCESAQCLSDNHCAYNEVCEDYQCLQCNCGYPDREEFMCHDLIGMGNVAGDCYRADNGLCVFEYSACDKCDSNDDCSRLDKGICVGGQCESAQCLSDNHCAYNEVCEGFQCTPCNCGYPDREEFMCHDLSGLGNVAADCYRTDSGQCVFQYSACEKCDNNGDCSKLDKGICIGGQCESAQCLSDNQCAYNEVCEKYECVPCNCGHPDREASMCHDLVGMGNVAGDCYRADDGQCVFEYSACDACDSIDDCSKLDKGICIGGQCESAQCLSDNHCAYNEVCEDYQCLQCNCGYPDREEFMCHDLIGMGNVAGDCYRADNGLCVFEYSACDKCDSNDDCSKLDKGICVGGQCESAVCLSDNHCAHNEVCEDYQCIPCNCGYPDREEFICHDLIGLGNVAGDCYRADGGQCVFEYSACDKCGSNDDCHRLNKGICVNGQCESAQCLSDNHCAYNEVCENYECIPCNCGYPDREEFLCHDLVGKGNVAGECYRSNNGQCVFTYSACDKCDNNIDCSNLDKGICVGGLCESAQCLSDNHCAYNEVCGDNQCIACDCGEPDRAEFLCHDLLGRGDVATDCFRDENGQCGYKYTECAACGTNNDCYKLDKGICVDGQCKSAQCLSDNHCAYNEVCEDFTCVPCTCGSPDRVEFMCHDLIGMGDVAGDCYRAENGQCTFAYSECDLCDSNNDCHKLDKGICVKGHCESAQCLSDGHCAYNEVCRGNECVPCDCGLPDQAEFQCHDLIGRGNVPQDCYRAETGQCLFKYSQCDACSSNGDCRKLDKGICVGGQCESAQCFSDNHCAYNEVCEDYECVPCNCGYPDRQEFMCHDLIGMGNVAGDCYRAAGDGHCVFEYSECAKCDNNNDCSRLDKGICVNGQCESAQCLTDNHCADNEICEDNECEPCTCGLPDRAEFLCHDHSARGNVPEACYRSENGQCVYEYSKCEQCYSDDDCSRLDKGICVGGQCESAECLVDDHCGHDELCLENQCVKCDCGSPSKQQHKCHDNINFGNVPGPCLREDGQCVQEYSTCNPCRGNADCSQVFNGVCRAGTCESAECLLDNQCNDSQKCDGGYCVACDCGHPVRGDEHCFDGTVAGPDMCINKNGDCKWTYTECPLCDVDFKCPYGYKCKNGECVKQVVKIACSSSYDCDHQAPFCLHGYCSETGCSRDGDCRQNESCDSRGHCKAKRTGFY